MRPALLAPVLSLALAAAVPAQAGTFTTFGAGCTGSGMGGKGCVSQNWDGTTRSATGVNSPFAILANSGSSARLVCAVELWCATRSPKPVTMNVWLYDRATSSPNAPNKIIASSTMKVGTVNGPWRALFLPPVVLQANTAFFVVFDNAVGNLTLPISQNGGTIGTHYYMSGTTWNGPFTSSLCWNYNLLCCGTTAAPVLSNNGLPAINKAFAVDLFAARTNSAAALFLGASNSAWGPIPLPLDLTSAGAPGCKLLTSIDVIGGVPVGTDGTATMPFAVPNDSGLLGVGFHLQWAVLDSINKLGFAFSNAGTAKIGT
ncbi:MAG: hypothetical protein R3F30_15615 [Planctomycetota bacterium]